ncbi:gp46 recombination endonuclease subunit [Klebsiella phage vB_KpM-Mild]|jgi:DNA repair exonuclease SbcCD ATPase subunit|uniref:Phage recombination-related endonuclease Gp46 n=1 Tax=Klebsiella phage PMBT1 TaxID=1880822 RepID=A0A1G4GQ12_9CAUD|nr:SbcC-like subunit of palindrome specific endonuclease [Klebsiella phage PMBT1]QEG10287.1 recombination-related endonuclease [Klebsiella phage KMI7]UUG67042.1 exonuclease subunit 2 [Klebsiella phage PSKm2DI]UZO33426.1 exonuclease subunit 2 [Klebsiella phage pR7_1]WDQ26331.1 exonuclease subunit 2 [Klebsiella phage phi_KPN_S3]CAD5241731.1 gp46 recombination endonuclease subunit [Klebsiella phage vB_KpM-Mild]CAK6607152.1 SbcC-like subunit of palindrome specific endonuclease [Klebsiella phage v
MKLKFKTLTYQNILSVGNVPIVIDFDSAKKTLITGKNGGGKSTMIEALTYALFGKSFRDLKVGQLVNSINKKKCLVELLIEYGNDEYKIIRGQKPKVFEIWKNGEKLPEDSAAGDYQSQLESMLNINLVGFKQVIVLGTAGYVPFMELKTPDRRKLVEDLLSLSIISEMDKLNKSYIRGVNRELDTLSMQIGHVQQQIATHQKFIDEQRAKANQNTARYQDIYDSHVETAKQIKAQLVELQTQIAECVINGEDQTANIQKLRDGYTRLSMNVEQLQRLEVMYRKGGECPACKQPISPTPERMEEIAENIKNGTQKLTLIKNKQDQLQKIMDDLLTQQRTLNGLKSKYESLRGTLQNEVAAAKRVRAVMDKAQEDVVIDESPVEKLREDEKELDSKRSGFVKEKYFRGIVTDLLKDSGVKASIVKRYIPYFNKQIAYYLDLLGADYQFTLDDEFNESIKSLGRNDFSYASFSQGERARINLALLFTWRDVTSKISGVDLSLLILDEVYDGAIDRDGSFAVKALLDGINGNVIVISHQDLDPEDFDRHIVMSKVGRFSKMEVKKS